MNYSIKTVGGYVARFQGPPQTNRVILLTPERASARWYQTESAAQAAATRLKIPQPYELQHCSA